MAIHTKNTIGLNNPKGRTSKKLIDVMNNIPSKSGKVKETTKKVPNLKTTPKASRMSITDKKALGKTLIPFINSVNSDGSTEKDLYNIIGDLPITNLIVNYSEKNTNLIPTSAILMSLLSKYSHFNSRFRTGVHFNNKIITPNLFTLVILKSGFGKDATSNVIDECFDKSRISNDMFVNDIYKEVEERVRVFKATAGDSDAEYPHYIPTKPSETFNMASSTAEGYHSLNLDLNAVNFGAVNIKSGEFFDTIIHGKSSKELIERVKNDYYHGSEISKTIKSKEFKSPKTLSAGICASFHSAMELSDSNKEQVIDFAKNGLSRRLMVSMSSEYRFQEMSYSTNVDYSNELDEIQEILEYITKSSQKHYNKMSSSIDYDNAVYNKQLFSRVLNFSEEAQVLLIELSNFFIKRLKHDNDDTFITVLEQVIKIATNLHLIEDSTSPEISIDMVKTAFRLYSMYNIDKDKYDEKIFSNDIKEAYELLLNNKMSRTNFFGMQGLKKTRATKNQKDSILDDLEDYVNDRGMVLSMTVDKRTTMYEIIEESEIVLDEEILDECEMDGME